MLEHGILNCSSRWIEQDEAKLSTLMLHSTPKLKKETQCFRKMVWGEHEASKSLAVETKLLRPAGLVAGNRHWELKTVPVLVSMVRNFS